MANTHTHSFPSDTPGGCSLEQGSNAILAHVGIARPLIKLMGYEHREDAVRVGELAMTHTQTHAHTHTVFLVIHRMDGGSGKDRTHC